MHLFFPVTENRSENVKSLREYSAKLSKEKSNETNVLPQDGDENILTRKTIRKSPRILDRWYEKFPKMIVPFRLMISFERNWNSIFFLYKRRSSKFEASNRHFSFAFVFHCPKRIEKHKFLKHKIAFHSCSKLSFTLFWMKKYKFLYNSDETSSKGFLRKTSKSSSMRIPSL